MTCVVCKNKKMTRGTTVLPIERGKAVLLVTNIPARICANCGEPYIDEKTAKEVEALANEELNFFFNETASTEIYTLSLHDALPILELAIVFSLPFLTSCIR